MSVFFKVLNTASGGVTIDDENSSTQSTYSSFEINRRFNEIGGVLGDINNLNMDLKTLIENANLDINFINALNQVFQYGNNVKANTVTALLAKGATGVTVYSSWTEIVNAINTMFVNPGGSGTGVIGELQRITKLNMSVGDIKTINLGRTVEDLKLATSVLLFVPGPSGVVEHICGYDNSDSGNFIYDANSIIFDGKMKPINIVNIPWSSTGTVGSYNCSEAEIDESLYKAVDGLSDDDTNNILIENVIPKDQIVLGKGDIDLSGIQTLKSVSISSAGFRFALSFDGGVTYQTWDGYTWTTLDINNIDDIKAKFMSKATLDSLTYTQFEAARNNSTTLRIAYFPDQVTSLDSCYTDQLDITVDEPGQDIISPQANWDYKLLDDQQTIEYTFYVSGTYTINYV